MPVSSLPLLDILWNILRYPHSHLPSALSTLYLGVIGGVFGILCYFLLQKNQALSRASLVFLVFPIIAISLENYIYGYAISLLSQLLTLPLAIGILLILVCLSGFVAETATLTEGAGR